MHLIAQVLRTCTSSCTWYSRREHLGLPSAFSSTAFSSVCRDSTGWNVRCGLFPFLQSKCSSRQPHGKSHPEGTSMIVSGISLKAWAMLTVVSWFCKSTSHHRNFIGLLCWSLVCGTSYAWTMAKNFIWTLFIHEKLHVGHGDGAIATHVQTTSTCNQAMGWVKSSCNLPS